MNAPNAHFANGTGHLVRVWSSPPATRLADADCTEAQIKAVTGHQTGKEVERYTKPCDQRRLAEAAFALIGGTQRGQPLANPIGELAKISRN
ncbi:MAG: hypothetical protein KL785_04660 [Brevundimonas sp.]|nr:hypothetical protein [Brevundimonas sp.]